MKLPRVRLIDSRKAKREVEKKYADYYQKNLNSFGKHQMETIIKKGLSLSW